MLWTYIRDGQEGLRVRVEEVVGLRMREIRDGKGMTQEQLGQEVGKMLGKPWPRQPHPPPKRAAGRSLPSNWS